MPGTRFPQLFLLNLWHACRVPSITDPDVRALLSERTRTGRLSSMLAAFDMTG
jgi:hypothetical protein